MPKTAAATKDVPWTIDIHGIQHIDDPTGQDRRLFEGWASLGGIDYQDMEIAPGAFESMAEEYLRKNPVILWDHIRHLPIGTVHSLTFADEGLYLKGEIWRLEDLDWDDEEETRKAKSKDEVFVGTENIAKKCDQVWKLIVSGKIRGLSVRGKARQYVPVYSESLQQYVPRVTEFLLYEISVTPIQVHPGAQITAVNTIAKSLEICKSLPIAPGQDLLVLNKPTPKQPKQTGQAEQCAKGAFRLKPFEPGAQKPVIKPIQRPQSAKQRSVHAGPPMPPVTTRQAKYTYRGNKMSFDTLREQLSNLHSTISGLGNGQDSVEIPEDIAKSLQSLGGSVEMELPNGGEVEKGLQTEPAPAPASQGLDLSQLQEMLTSTVQASVAPINDRLQKLEEVSPYNTPVAPQARVIPTQPSTVERPSGAKPKPTGIQGEGGGGGQAVEKALARIAKSKDGFDDLGSGTFHGCGINQAAKLMLLDGTMKGFFKGGETITLDPHARALLADCGGA